MDGMTYSDVAQELSARLGWTVTPQDINYVIRRRGVPVHAGTKQIVISRVITVHTVSRADLLALEEAVRVLPRRQVNAN